MHIKVKNNGNKKAIDGAWLLNLGLHKAKQNDKFTSFIHPSLFYEKRLSRNLSQQGR